MFSSKRKEKQIPTSPKKDQDNKGSCFGVKKKINFLPYFEYHFQNIHRVQLEILLVPDYL